jgi:sortase (surface protein transpeptidase)
MLGLAERLHSGSAQVAHTLRSVRVNVWVLRVCAASAFVALLVGGIMAAGLAGSAGAPNAEPSPTGKPPAPSPPAVAHQGLIAASPQRLHAAPVRLIIPSIGVDTTVEQVGLRADGTLQQPSGWHVAGWYTGSVRPGDIGPAIIIGHVDSVNGPAVFFRLRELQRGQVVTVQGSDGRPVTFVVDTAAAYAKTNLPTNAVYGATTQPELRLVTCTGAFDYNARSYVDNLVVSAHMV